MKQPDQTDRAESDKSNQVNQLQLSDSTNLSVPTAAFEIQPRKEGMMYHQAGKIVLNGYPLLKEADGTKIAMVNKQYAVVMPQHGLSGPNMQSNQLARIGYDLTANSGLHGVAPTLPGQSYHHGAQIPCHNTVSMQSSVYHLNQTHQAPAPGNFNQFGIASTQQSDAVSQTQFEVTSANDTSQRVARRDSQQRQNTCNVGDATVVHKQKPISFQAAKSYMGGSSILQSFNQSSEQQKQFWDAKKNEEVESDKENYDYKNIQMSCMHVDLQISHMNAGQGFGQHSQFGSGAGQWNQGQKHQMNMMKQTGVQQQQQTSGMNLGSNKNGHFPMAAANHSVASSQNPSHQHIICGKDDNPVPKRASVAINGLNQPVGYPAQNCQHSNSNMHSNVASNQESLENIFKYPTQPDVNNTKYSINFPRGTTNTKRGFARDAQNQQSTDSQFSQGIAYDNKRPVQGVGSVYTNSTQGGANKFQIHPLLQGNLKASLHQQLGGHQSKNHSMQVTLADQIRSENRSMILPMDNRKISDREQMMIIDNGSGNQSSDNVKPQLHERDSIGQNPRSQGPGPGQNHGQGDLPKYKVVNYDYSSSQNLHFKTQRNQSLLSGVNYPKKGFKQMGRREDSGSIGGKNNSTGSQGDSSSLAMVRSTNNQNLKDNINKLIQGASNTQMPQITNVVQQQQRSGGKKHTFSQISAPQIIGNTSKPGFSGQGPSQSSKHQKLVSGHGSIQNPTGENQGHGGGQKNQKSSSVTSTMSGVEVVRSQNHSTVGATHQSSFAGQVRQPQQQSKSNDQKETQSRHNLKMMQQKQNRSSGNNGSKAVQQSHTHQNIKQANDSHKVKQHSNPSSTMNLSGPQEAKVSKRKKKMASQEEDRELIAKHRNKAIGSQDVTLESTAKHGQAVHGRSTITHFNSRNLDDQDKRYSSHLNPPSVSKNQGHPHTSKAYGNQRYSVSSQMGLIPAQSTKSIHRTDASNECYKNQDCHSKQNASGQLRQSTSMDRSYRKVSTQQRTQSTVLQATSSQYSAEQNDSKIQISLPAVQQSVQGTIGSGQNEKKNIVQSKTQRSNVLGKKRIVSQVPVVLPSNFQNNFRAPSHLSKDGDRDQSEHILTSSHVSSNEGPKKLVFNRSEHSQKQKLLQERTSHSMAGSTVASPRLTKEMKLKAINQEFRKRVGVHMKTCVLECDKKKAMDPQEVAEFTRDVMKHYFATEIYNQPKYRYMDHQPYITERMRSILIDWIIEVHFQFKLKTESLFLTVNLIDRYLERIRVTKENLQLVGVSAMLIACKYEEIWPPLIKDYIHMCDNAYTKDQIINMELSMLSELDFNVDFVSSYSFLERLSSMTETSIQTRHLAQYLIEISMLDYESMHTKPSYLAASALYLAGQLLRQNERFSLKLVAYTKYSEANMQAQSQILLLLLKNYHKPSYQLAGLKKKFGSDQFSNVSQLSQFDLSNSCQKNKTTKGSNNKSGTSNDKTQASAQATTTDKKRTKSGDQLMANFTTQKSNSSSYATSTKKKGANFQFNQRKNSQRVLDQNPSCLGKAAVRNAPDAVETRNEAMLSKHCQTQESARNSKKGNYKGCLRSQRPSVTVATEDSHQYLIDKCCEKALNSTSNTQCHVSSHSLHQALPKPQYIKIESQRYKDNKNLKGEGQQVGQIPAEAEQQLVAYVQMQHQSQQSHRAYGAQKRNSLSQYVNQQQSNQVMNRCRESQEHHQAVRETDEPSQSSSTIKSNISNQSCSSDEVAQSDLDNDKIQVDHVESNYSLDNSKDQYENQKMVAHDRRNSRASKYQQQFTNGRKQNANLKELLQSKQYTSEGQSCSVDHEMV